MGARLLLYFFVLVELNCENLFDTQHDSLHQDEAFLPTSEYHWTPGRYWRKLNHISQALLAAGEVDTLRQMPDLMVLTEVENDSVMRDLTRRSPLRHAGYRYVMTDSPDLRGIDVAIAYSPFSFRLINHCAMRIKPEAGQRPTRDILYASGELLSGDTLHVFALHAPSRLGGEKTTRPYRLRVVGRVCEAIDSVRAVCRNPLIVVAGDFNDYVGDASLQLLETHGLSDVSAHAAGTHGARGTYRYRGQWGSLDHVVCSEVMARRLQACRVVDPPFLTEEDKKYGGVKPRRTYLGPRYMGGFSDHLPLVAVFSF